MLPAVYVIFLLDAVSIKIQCMACILFNFHHKVTQEMNGERQLTTFNFPNGASEALISLSPLPCQVLKLNGSWTIPFSEDPGSSLETTHRNSGPLSLLPYW